MDIARPVPYLRDCARSRTLGRLSGSLRRLSWFRLETKHAGNPEETEDRPRFPHKKIIDQTGTPSEFYCLSKNDHTGRI
jgi:hypothetical protein